MQLFGTSGIRGVFPKDIDAKLALKLGLAAAHFFGEGATVIVARDNRFSSASISHAIISGLTGGGCDVIYLGICPTPAALWYLKAQETTGAIIVTGSHMPAERIGILFFKDDTSEFSREEEEAFMNVLNKDLKFKPWDRTGDVVEDSAKDFWIEGILSLVDIDKIAEMKVVIDTAGGACSGGYLREVLESAEIFVHTINDSPDSLFRLRDPFPRLDNLIPLMKIVKETNSDIGVGTDTDGDRAIFTSASNIYWGDVSGAIFIRQLISQGIKEFVVTANTSLIVEKIVRDAGGVIHYCDIGAPDIVEEMKKKDVYFGMEETGKYIWVDSILYSDVALATLKMLEILVDTNLSLDELAQTLPKTHIEKISIPCPEEKKPNVISYVKENADKLGDIEKKIELRTGIRVFFKDESSLLLRASGTEPVFRIYAEAKTKKRVEELLRLGEKFIKKALS